jgi:(heptosyl)LPS beta-1,4-glucosyltransferase
MSRHPISVLLISKNEQTFIERCIRSVSWSDQVLLLDSGSTDRTVEIAESLGADVIRTPDYPGWAAQFNRAADKARNDWVFIMDCDEIVTPALARSIQATAESPMQPQDAYAVNRRGDFLGALLPNSSNRANTRKLVRLYNRRHSRFADDWKVHGQIDPSGLTHLLDGDLIHWRGYVMDEYFSVFNAYASQEAAALDEKGARAGGFDLVARPMMRFLWLYVRKGEWRFGTRGLIHAGLKASSEFMRYAKLWERQNVPEAVLHPPETTSKNDKASKAKTQALRQVDV